MKDDIRNLYDALVKNGYSIDDLGGSEDNFRANMRDEKIRGEFYDWVVGRDDFNIGSREAYEKRMTGALNPTSEQGIIPELLGVPYPAPEVDKSQYTFTGEQLGLEDPAYEAMKVHAASPQMPDGSATLPTENRTREELLAERKRLEDAKSEAELRLRTRRGEIASPSGMYQMGMAPVTGNQAAEITDPEMTKLYAAVNSYDNAIRSVDRKLSGEEPGFWEGVADATVRNPGFYTMGLTDMSDARGMLNIAQNGIEGREDELLADAIYSKNAEQQDEDFGFLYRAGNMFGHSVPFMVQTAVTGGFSGSSRAGANLAGRLGKKAAEGTIKKKIINAMGTTIDDVIEAGLIANTAGAGGTWANIAERKAGKINIKDGDYVFENGESWLGALYKGEVSSILELYTEKLGGHLEGKLSLTKGLDKIGASRVSNVLLAAKNSDLYKGASTVMRQFGLNGYLPEVLEEEANLVLNSLLVGDNSLSELYNPKTQLDIFGGMLLTVGTMQAIPGTIATAGYVKNQYQMNRADRRAADVFGEDWEAVKEALDNATNEKVAGVVSENLRDNENQNKALLDYYKRMMIMRGYNIGTVKNETAPDIEEAYTEGYSQEPTGVNAMSAVMEYNQARMDVARALGLAEDADVDAFLNGRSAEEVALGDADVETAIVNYQMQKARKEGLQERFQQTRAKQYEESDRSIDKIANNGVVYSTTINGEQVYITGGTVVLDEQGFIDVNNSNNLFCLMPDGTKKPKSENELREKISIQNAEDLKAAKRAEINDRWRAEFDTAEEIAESAKVKEPTAEASQNGNLVPGAEIEVAFDGEIYKLKVDGRDERGDIILSGEGESMALPESVVQEGIKQAKALQTENGKVKTESQSEVAPTGDNVAPVAPDVPDFFRMNGKNYEVASRNDDGSVDVVIDGKRETLPAGTDYSTLMPTDKKGEVQYEQMPVERTHEYFVQKVKDDEARAEMIEKRRKKAEAERKKFDKKPDPGLDPDKWAEVNRKWEEGKKAAQAKVDYWNEVAKREAEITRSETREAENIEQQRAEAEAWAMGTFNMTLEELYVYEETLLPRLTREFEGFDYNKYYNNLAGNYENDTTRESESIGRGGEVLQGEQSVPASGAPAVGVRNEGGAVSNDVQGGGQNGVAQEEAVNEPVGNSEQLSSSDIPNNQSVAGLEGYSTSEILDLVKGHIFEALGEDVRIVDMRIIGSRTNGTNNADSDLDVLVEYEGEISEDSFFNAVNDEEGALYIDGIRVDINPITKDKSGSIEQWMNRNKGYSKAEGNAPGQSGVYADNQGNPVDADGKLIIDEVNSIDEITDEDFETPTRNVQLPAIPENVAIAIGANGRPIVIKKNVFEKNGNTHVELEPEDSRNILRSALYNPNLVGSTQPIRRPDYKVAIRTGEQNAVVVLDVYQEKDFVEIVGWRIVNERGLAKMQRQAEREGGQFLILSPNDGSAAALSALPLGLFSASEDRNSVSNSQENTQKSGEIAENGGEVTETTANPTDSEPTEQPEAGEVADAGPVNRETLQLNMSEEDFNALLSSGDKAAISEYLAEMDGLLRIGVGSPLDGRDAIVKEYRGLVEQYGGEENIPADVVAGIDERIAPYNALQRAVFDRKYALQDKLREIEASEAQAKEQAEKEAKAEHKQTAFGGFLAGKSDVGASTAEKALGKRYKFDDGVHTVAEYIEQQLENSTLKIETREEPKYKGVSRQAWNRMDARQQAAEEKRVKEGGMKTVYSVNNMDLGKTAYDYAKFLLEKKAEQEKAAAKQKVKDAIEPFAKEKAAEQAPIKIEDVGEKIGGARKDIIRQYADKIKLDGKTFSTMFPKPDIDKLVEAGLPKDKVAAVKAMYDNAKKEFEIAKKRRGKDKALQASLFYAMYAKNVLTGEEGNFDLAYNGYVFTEWGKEFMKANIALYKAVFNKLGADYGKVDLRSYFITPLAAGMRENFNLKKLNEENSRMQQRMAEMDGRKVPEYKDGDVINFVGEHYSRPSDQFETLEEAVNTMVERISKEVKVDEAAQYKVESYWKRDAQGRADYTKAYLGIKVRGFGTVDVMEFKNMSESRAWLQDHREDFQQMAAAKEEQVRAEKKKPLPKYVLGHSYNEAQSQYSVFADFGKDGVRILKTFDIPQAEGVAAQAKVRSEVYKNEVLPYINSEEAVQSADGIAQEIRDAKNAKPKSITIEKKSRERVGVDWRNGKDASPEMFVDVEGKETSVFGFRAIEFGNYVSQKERQQFLNDIYDALMDMSEILGVSPRALSLGGKLALAVGARGTSGASGHYEPYKNVINITKNRGAGVLAHEWLHALDRYFSNFDENMVYPNGTRYATQQEYADDTRQEVKDAFEKVMLAVKASDYRDRSMRLGEYWASEKELAARALQDYVIRKLEERGQKNDFLSNHVAPEEWDGDAKDYPFPLGEDVVYIGDAFDNFFATLQERAVDGQTVLYSIGEDYLLEEKETEAFKRATKTTKEAVERLKANGLEVEIRDNADDIPDNAEPQTSKEIEGKYPNWLEGTTTDSGKHSTQVEGTRKTYKKIGDWIEENLGKDVAILDASSGMGYGTADLRERGFNIEDVEPYQSEERKQNNPATYSSYGDIDKQYDYIISNAVLNVIPDDWRAGVLHDMADRLKSGGKIFINTRKAGEEKSIKDKIELDSPQEVLVKRNGRIASYQRFFTPQELKEWVESELGDGYTVEVANKTNSGTNGLAAVVVTKNNESPANGKTSESGQPISNHKGMANASLTNVSAKVGKNAERANRLDAIISSIEEFGEMGPHEFLHEVVNAMLLSNNVSTDVSRYAKLGGGVTLRLADHYGNASNYKGRKDAITNYGLVVKLSTKAFVPDNKVDYLEYVYFPDKLTKERQIEIAKGLKAFMETGRYELLPKPDKVHPSGKFVGRTELSTTNGKVYGWAVDGKIYLTPDGINPNTPVHEYAHLWGADVEKNNPKLWNEVVESMKLSPVWNEVANDANYSNIHGNDSRMASEVLARLSGRENYRRTMEEAQKEIEQAKTIEEKAEKISRWAKVKAALKNFWNWVQRNVFRKKENATGSATKEMKPWDEFVNSAIGDFYKGKNPNVKESSLERMFVGENSAEMQEEETRFRTIEETSDGSIDDVPTQPLTLMERITNSLLEVSAKNKENLGLRADALRAYGRDMENLLKLMRAQREYDKFTVDTLVKLAKMYFKNAQLLGEVTPYEVARIMGVLNRSVGKRDVSSEAAKLMDILLDAHTNALAGILEKAEKVKAKKVNAAGVEVMGRLDKYGQISVDEYRTGKEMTSEKLEEAIYDSDNRLAELEQRVREALGLPEGDMDQAARDYTGDNNVVDVYLDERARLEGLTLAREYKESIQQVQEEIKNLKRELKQAEEDYRLGNIDGKSLKEFRKSVAEAIMESKAELIEGYHDLIYKFQEGVKKSSQRANAFVQAQIDRAREIQHNANSDMEGIEADSQGKHPERFNNSVTRTLMSPMPTFQGMLKKFGEKNVEGKGYLYERFMPQATKASDNEFRGKVAARVMIETKLKEIYGGDMDLGKFMKSLREPGITVTYREGNKMKEFELTQGQMLYIYMVNKMSDGQMKLRRMGITDDVVAELMTTLPEDTIRFADWVQDELLKDLRGKYNAVHERVFGAPMAAIENYFPIKIRKEARGEKGDVSEIGQEGKPSTITGSIIKRTKNAIAIDLSADAMQVLMEHIDDMEHWAAFAEFNRDINTLLNYRHFQNQVKNMTSLRYGSGVEMWENFQKTAKIVSGTYKSSDVDKAVLNIFKGLTRAKINFRGYTAVKQLLSAPAFWTDAGVKELSYCYVNPKGCWIWAKENLPGFAERWEGRKMGNEKLLKSDSDWEIWRNEFVEAATRWGMTPNAAIDALTVAQGARAVYMTKLKQFKKAGYTEQRANEKALQAAAEAYNESQQSSEGMYLSPLQVEGTALAAVFTTFKNSNFGYSRKVAQSVANVRRKMRNGYKEEAIAFMTKQMVRDGLSEDNAKKMAEKVYKKSWYNDIANVAMFGFALPALWTWGGYAIYMILGDDDEEKERMKEEIALRGALGFLDGIPLGESVISAINAVKEGDAKYFRLPELIAVGDIRNLAQVLNGDAVRGANDVINLVTAMGVGVSPQILTDFLVAISEIKDFSLEEFGMFTARVMSAPQSNLDALMVDDAMENSAHNLADIAERYIQFKTKRNAPITQFFYSDETEQKVIERYAGRFASMLEDNFENVVDDNNAYDLFYDSASPEVKEVLASYRKNFLAGDKADDFQKKSIKRLVLDLLEFKSTEYSVYWNMTNPEDEETAFLIESELNRLEPIKKGEKDADNLSEYKKLFKKELKLYKKLNNALREVNKYKRKMQKSPDTRERGMTKIREKRAEAIELINNYRNNE